MVGRQAEVGDADRLVDGLDHALVPDLNGDQARLGNGDGRDLVHRHRLAVGLDMDRFDQARGGATGAQTAEFVAAAPRWRPACVA